MNGQGDCNKAPSELGYNHNNYESYRCRPVYATSWQSIVLTVFSEKRVIKSFNLCHYGEIHNA